MIVCRPSDSGLEPLGASRYLTIPEITFWHRGLFRVYTSLPPIRPPEHNILFPITPICSQSFNEWKLLLFRDVDKRNFK